MIKYINSFIDFSYRNKVGSLENLDTGTQRDELHEKREHSLPIQINYKPNKENVSSPVSWMQFY